MGMVYGKVILYISSTKGFTSGHPIACLVGQTSRIVSHGPTMFMTLTFSFQPHHIVQIDSSFRSLLLHLINSHQFSIIPFKAKPRWACLPRTVGCRLRPSLCSFPLYKQHTALASITAFQSPPLSTKDVHHQWESA